MIEIRELKPEEIPSAARIVPGSLVMGVLDNGRVIAILAAFTSVFLDPLWVEPESRNHSVGFLRPLWDRMKSRLRQADIQCVIGHADSTQPNMATLLSKIGGKEVVGKRQFVLLLGE